MKRNGPRPKGMPRVVFHKLRDMLKSLSVTATDFMVEGREFCGYGAEHKANDEGYTHTFALVKRTFDGRYVVEVRTYSLDCDGRLTTTETYDMSLRSVRRMLYTTEYFRALGGNRHRKLAIPVRRGEVRQGKYRLKLRDRSQRDYTAEAAGY